MASKKKSERFEALFRIIVMIIGGIILTAWSNLVFVFIFINFIITFLTGNRNKGIAEFCEFFNTELYRFFHYISFVSNERPFPFSSLERMGKFK